MKAWKGKEDSDGEIGEHDNKVVFDITSLNLPKMNVIRTLQLPLAAALFEISSTP